MDPIQHRPFIYMLMHPLTNYTDVVFGGALMPSNIAKLISTMATLTVPPQPPQLAACRRRSVPPRSRRGESVLAPSLVPSHSPHTVR